MPNTLTQEYSPVNEVFKNTIYARQMYLRYKYEFALVTLQNMEWISDWNRSYPDRHKPGQHYHVSGNGKDRVIVSPYKEREMKGTSCSPFWKSEECLSALTVPCMDSVLETLLENPHSLTCIGNVTSDVLAKWMHDGLTIEARQ